MLASAFSFALLAASTASAFAINFPRQTVDPSTLPYSPACINAGGALYQSPIATCFNIDGFFAAHAAPSNQSIIPPNDAWLKGMCAQPACAGTDLQAAWKSFSDGCRTDLHSMNVTDANIQAVTDAIPKYWPTVREILCLQDPSAPGTLCVTSLLTTLEKLIGQPLTEQAIMQHVPTLFAAGVPKELLCNKCFEGIVAILKRNGVISPSDYTGLSTYYQAQCGTPLPA